MNYAFGYAGDRDLQRNARYLELWQKIESRQDLEQFKFNFLYNHRK